MAACNLGFADWSTSAPCPAPPPKPSIPRPRPARSERFFPSAPADVPSRRLALLEQLAEERIQKVTSHGYKPKAFDEKPPQWIAGAAVPKNRQFVSCVLMEDRLPDGMEYVATPPPKRSPRRQKDYHAKLSCPKLWSVPVPPTVLPTPGSTSVPQSAMGRSASAAALLTRRSRSELGQTSSVASHWGSDGRRSPGPAPKPDPAGPGAAAARAASRDARRGEQEGWQATGKTLGSSRASTQLGGLAGSQSCAGLSCDKSVLGEADSGAKTPGKRRLAKPSRAKSADPFADLTLYAPTLRTTAPRRLPPTESRCSKSVGTEPCEEEPPVLKEPVDAEELLAQIEALQDKLTGFRRDNKIHSVSAAPTPAPVRPRRPSTGLASRPPTAPRQGTPSELEAGIRKVVEEVLWVAITLLRAASPKPDPKQVHARMERLLASIIEPTVIAVNARTMINPEGGLATRLKGEAPQLHRVVFARGKDCPDALHTEHLHMAQDLRNRVLSLPVAAALFDQ